MIFPTLVSELVTGTFTVNPPRTAWYAPIFRVVGSNHATWIERVVLAAKVLVVKSLPVI
jgi:hypothetical protein